MGFEREIVADNQRRSASKPCERTRETRKQFAATPVWRRSKLTVFAGITTSVLLMASLNPSNSRGTSWRTTRAWCN